MRAVLLLVFGLIASMPTKFLKLYTEFSGVFLLFGGTLLMIVMLALAPTYRSASWVFGAFRSGDAEAAGISNWGCGLSRPMRLHAHLLSSCPPVSLYACIGAIYSFREGASDGDFRDFFVCCEATVAMVRQQHKCMLAIVMG